jgi:PIN domain nuclease of toxin-antitoxin system
LCGHPFAGDCLAPCAGRINNRTGVNSCDDIQDVLTGMKMTVLPITPEIAELAQDLLFVHGDPADRRIGATALALRAALVASDEKLRALPGLRCIW